jgi:hypothetical protein
MSWARGRRLLVGVSLCAALLSGCGEETAKCGQPPGATCGGPGGAGGGGMGATGGSGGTSGVAGMAGSGGMSGMGGSGGSVMEPPIMGPAPTACVPMAAATTTVMKMVLHTGSEELMGLALRREDLFAADAMGIVRLAEGTTSLARVTMTQVDEVMAADLRLYWVDASSLFRVDYDAMAEAPELVASGLQAPATLLRHDETNVFYAHASTSSVWRQPIDGTAGAQLVTGASVKDLHVQGGSVFYAAGQAIKSVEIESGEVTDIVTAAPRAVLDIDTNGIELVWSDGVEVFTTDIEDQAMSVALTQAGPSATGSGQSRITHLALHGTAIYFADAAGNIGTAGLSGATCSLLHTGMGEVRGLAVLDEHKLFVNVRVGESSELWAIMH